MYRDYVSNNMNGIDVSVKNKNANVVVSVPKKTNAGINMSFGTDMDKFYRFTQAVASNIWTIQHNLDKYPSVTVVDSGNNVVVGDIEYIDKNNVVITFTASFVGKAYFN